MPVDSSEAHGDLLEDGQSTPFTDHDLSVHLYADHPRTYSSPAPAVLFLGIVQGLHTQCNIQPRKHGATCRSVDRAEENMGSHPAKKATLHIQITQKSGTYISVCKYLDHRGVEIDDL